MLTKFLQKSYQQWIEENVSNLTIDDFVAHASVEYKMDPEDVKKVLEGRRSGFNSFTQYHSIVENAIESKLQSFYNTWAQAPVEHTHADFVDVCSQEFEISSKELESKLATYSWYKLP